jgi:phenylacetate-CoA ligase
LENRATVLCCTPTYALHLAGVAKEEGVRFELCAVRRLVVAGEPGGSDPAVRARLSAAWRGARVFDHHGMTETGPVTYEDPASPGFLRVMEGSFFAEVIAPDSGEPVAEGAAGELVLTTLSRVDSPLIRYRTGDLVRPRRVGAEGPLLLEGGILGRVDDMVVVRGVNVYPTAVDRWVRIVPGVAEYRVTLDQRSPLAEISLEVEANAEDAALVGTLLQENLGLRIPVMVASPGSLPRFELKARRWRRIRDDGTVTDR